MARASSEMQYVLLKRALVISARASRIYACVGKPEKVTGLAVPPVSLSLADFQLLLSWKSAEETEMQEILLRHLLAMWKMETSTWLVWSWKFWLTVLVLRLVSLHLSRAVRRSASKDRSQHGLKLESDRSKQSPNEIFE